MKGWQVALLVGGLAAAGGVVYLVTRPKAPPPPPAASAARGGSSLQSTAGALISQVGGRALSLGIDKLSDYASDFFA